MGDNKKPILSVLVDEEKKRLFADLARANKQSMGWLLNQAIDKMLEAGSIHVYRDSINPIDESVTRPLPSTDIEEVVRRYVDEAITPLNDDLLSLQSQLAELTTKASVTTRNDFDPAAIQAYIDRCCEGLQAQLVEVKQDCDFTTEGVMRLIDAAISKASIEPKSQTKEPRQIISKTSPTPGEPSKNIRSVMTRLEKEPELRAAVSAGLTAGHTGEKLGQYLAEKGFLNGNGAQYTGASNSQFRLAIEYLNHAG